MIADPRVRQLVDQLLETDATPEEVCATHPELLPEVRLRWQRVRRLRGDMDALFPPEGSEPSLNETALPQVPGHRVDSLLGRGGMGVVFRAWHLRLNRPVALKMMLSGAYAGPRDRERFHREAEAVAELRHPNVVQVHDAGDADGRPYFTMELVEGGSLAQSLIGTPMAVDRAAELVGKLASAVQVAHEAGIVHRDLKPSNVLLTADGTPKVSDFGLARRLSDEQGLTLTGVALGTPSYMAPEQAGGTSEAVGPASDVYSLGAILYELLTGRPPFRGETHNETVQQLLAHDPVRPSRLNPRISRDLETICMKCLQKSPRQRYKAAGEMADDLGRFRRGDAIVARPDGLVRRWARRFHRRPLLSAAIAGVFVLSTVLLGGALWVASERAAVLQTVDDDLNRMDESTNRSEWSEARAALARAKARLGGRGSIDLHRRIEKAEVELTLVAKLDAARLVGSRSFAGKYAFDESDHAYETAFLDAGVWLPGDAPEVVAARIKASSVSLALINGLDSWAGLTENTDIRKERYLEIALLADPDANGWRKRTQDPAIVGDKARLEQVANDVIDSPAADPRVSMFIEFADRCRKAGIDPSPMLKKFHRAQPNDFWLNLRLGKDAEDGKRYEEAVQFYHAAVVLRSDVAIANNNLAMSLFRLKGRNEEAFEYLNEACRLDPESLNHRLNMVNQLTLFNRHAESIEHIRIALQGLPRNAWLHEVLARNLEAMNEDAKALNEHRKAVELDNRFWEAHRGLRNFFLRRGQIDEAMAAWKRAIACNPQSHDWWYGYAELCLYHGRDDEYRTTRTKLLARFGNEKDPPTAERVSRTCLLRPLNGGELLQAAALADRAAAADPAKFSTSLEYFRFAQGLADYRRGKLDQAAATMRGPASKVLGPAPKLVLAMSLYRKGEIAEARKTLTEAIASHDWSAAKARDQDGWVFHCLRREAESMVRADPAAKR